MSSFEYENNAFGDTNTDTHQYAQLEVEGVYTDIENIKVDTNTNQTSSTTNRQHMLQCISFAVICVIIGAILGGVIGWFLRGK